MGPTQPQVYFVSGVPSVNLHSQNHPINGISVVHFNDIVSIEMGSFTLQTARGQEDKEDCN